MGGWDKSEKWGVEKNGENEGRRGGGGGEEGGGVTRNM